jgi:outer membrane protein assembly factor BamB
MSWYSKCVSLALAAVAFLAGAALGDDWPGWRGIRGDGLSHEASAPLHWSATENIVWKVPVLGRGTSSPIIVKDSVFLTTFDQETMERRLVRYSVASGEVLWNECIHQGPIENQHRDNSSASATPTSDGVHIFTVFVDNQNMIVAACEWDGTIAWKKEIGTFFSKHGFSASPVLCQAGLVVNGHQDGDAFIALLDPATGEQKWRFAPDVNQRSFSTPIVTDFEGKQLLILAGANRTIALDSSTGTCVWKIEGPTEKVVSTVSVGLGHVFSFGGSPEPRAVGIRLGGQGDVTSSHVVWSLKKGMPYVPTPLLYEKYLHIVNDQGIYTCLDPLRGEALKTVRMKATTYSSPIGIAGRVYIFDDEGVCTVIENNANFETLAINPLGERCQATPAFANGQLIVRSDAHLWCIGTPTTLPTSTRAPTP